MSRKTDSKPTQSECTLCETFHKCNEYSCKRYNQQSRHNEVDAICEIFHKEELTNHTLLNGCYIVDNRYITESSADITDMLVPIVYIDGSYVQHKGLSSFGYAVEMNGVIVQKDSGLILDQDILSLKSVGAELYACIRAIEWAIANEYPAIYIVYDCEGIVQMIQSNKRKNKHKGKEKFLKLFAVYSRYIKLYFKRTNNEQLYRKHRISHDLSRTITELVANHTVE